MNEHDKNLQVVAPRDYMDIINKVASVKDVDVEKLEKLMKLQEEWERRQAALHYNEMMALAQGEMTRISKDSANPTTRSKYASLEALDEAIRPIYTRHGFSIEFNEEHPGERADGLVLSVYVSNGAETRRRTKYIPVTTTGIRGQVAMTPTHASVGAVTYGRRTLLKMVFNLAEEDDDGTLGRRPAPKMEGVDEVPSDARQADALATGDIIRAMQACTSHTDLYNYKEQILKPRWKDIFPADRERLEKEYSDLMTKFAEAQS